MSEERIEAWDGGWSWIAEPDDPIQRTSHALVTDDGVWLVDPVDYPGLDDEITDHGDVVGVVVLLDRHKRDAATIATRHDVPIHLPTPLAPIEDEFDAPVERFEDELADTGYHTIPLVTNRFWREVALYNETTKTLLVPESLGTIPSFRVGEERIGVNPPIRLFPPRTTLGDLTPDQLLVGHGPGVDEDVTPALQDTLDGARRRFPRAVLVLLRSLIG